MIQQVTVDFETEPIRPRPNYPPKPVGVSIKYPGKPSRYYAWGHPMRNNCTMAEGIRALKLAWDSKLPVTCHNLKFDMDVAEAHCGMPRLPWERTHDTMLMLFLDNPHAPKLALKPSAERLLGMPPEEQEAVRDWLMVNQDALRESGWLPMDVKLSMSDKAKPSASGEPQYWAAWICLAPGDLVGKYANGDVIRTEKISDKLLPNLKKRKMLNAYNRERKLVPILLDIERQGIRIDVERLERDVKSYSVTMAKIEKWLCKRIGVPDDFNLDADQQLIAALIDAGLIDTSKLGLTPKSKPEKPTYKSDQDSLVAAITDHTISSVLKYRSQLSTCLKTFMRPWLATALVSGGLIFTNWHQIRNEKSGARTGRFSSSPNFQNIPKEFKPIFKHDIPQEAVHATTPPDEQKRIAKARALRDTLPKAPFDLPALPLCRSYIVPFKPGHVLIDRDWSQQEPRIFAHFENGPLLKAYQDDPWLDLHDHAHELVNGMLGTDFARKQIKSIDLGLLYGMGIQLLADQAGVSYDEAKKLKNAVMKIFPGLKELNDDMKFRAQNDLSFRTWGGREYYCEPAKMIDGRMWTFDYKCINVVIQGSAADCMKEALIHYWEHKEPEAFFLMQIHDEFLASVPKHMIDKCMATMNTSMASPKFDVEMLSEGSISETNFAEMREYDKKGVRV